MRSPELSIRESRDSRIGSVKGNKPSAGCSSGDCGCGSTFSLAVFHFTEFNGFLVVSDESSLRDAISFLSPVF